MLEVAYTQVPDVHEPNNSRLEAAPISVGEDVEGYMFAGWVNSTGISEEDWHDWYELELEVGATSFLLSIVAADNDGEIVLYNSLGSQISNTYDNTDGSSVQLDYTIAEAGTYYVRVDPWNTMTSIGATNDIPQHVTMPYTLTVTQ